MSNPNEVWRIDIEDTTGSLVAVLKNFQYASFETRIGRRGSFRIQLADDDPNANKIGEDYIARFYYKNNAYNIGWINVFNGIIKTETRQWFSNGRKLDIFYGSDSNEIIDKALVMYNSSTSQANKDGLASSQAMYQLLVENIGASALISNGRYFDHNMPVTIVAVPNNTFGAIWSKNHANDQLIKACQDIMAFSQEQEDRCDFHTYYLGNYQWQVQIGKIFTDRTTIGLDPNTGLNGAGNVPVILSPLYNNIQSFTQTLSRIAEQNAVIGLGQRVGENREVFTAIDTISSGKSPIAQREGLIQGQNTTDMTTFVESELRKRVGRTQVELDPKLSPALVLFDDLVPGDFFTVHDFEGNVFHKQFVELKVAIQQTTGGSTITQTSIFVEERSPS